MKAKVAVHDFFFSDSVLTGNAEIIFYENDSTPTLYFQAPYFGMRDVPVDTIRNSQILRLSYKTPWYDINKPIPFDTFRDVPFCQKLIIKIRKSQLIPTTVTLTVKKPFINLLTVKSRSILLKTTIASVGS